MSQWKPAAELVELLHAVMPDDSRLAFRPMFGCPAYFSDAKLCCGAHAEQIFVRLPEAERARLLSEPGAARFEPLAGRPMREYVSLPIAWHTDPPRLLPWIELAVDYAASLPTPKQKRARSASSRPKKPSSSPASAKPARGSGKKLAPVDAARRALRQRREE